MRRVSGMDVGGGCVVEGGGRRTSPVVKPMVGAKLCAEGRE